ncbi:MAG TPA: YqeG family HAD IIIA-type phosphatase [Bacillota bacterium]|jgi:hypothetical protein
MSSKLRPGQLAPTIYDVNYELLWGNGIRGLVFDLDNTIVPWREAQPDERLVGFFAGLKARGFKLCIVSNALPARCARFADALGVPALPDCGKPRRGGFLRALRAMGTGPAETAVIGDQIFTDVLGANRVGLYTILVTPLSRKEFVWTRCVRMIERATLAAMRLKRPD